MIYNSTNINITNNPLSLQIIVYQLLAHGRWFSLGSPASSTTKTRRHDIAEILLKVALNTKNQSLNANKKDHDIWHGTSSFWLGEDTRGRQG